MVKAFYNKLQNKDISKPKIYLKKSLWDEIIKQYKTKNIFVVSLIFLEQHYLKQKMVNHSMKRV